MQDELTTNLGSSYVHRMAAINTGCSEVITRVQGEGDVYPVYYSRVTRHEHLQLSMLHSPQDADQ